MGKKSMTFILHSQISLLYLFKPFLSGMKIRCLHPIKSRLLALACVLVSLVSPAQSLVIETMQMPDTLWMNTVVSASITVRNTDSTGVQGNLQIWFQNQSLDNIEAALGGYQNLLQYFAPQQTRVIDVSIPVTPDFFIEGGNTVVIWPSMVGEPAPEDGFPTTIYVVDPNSTASYPTISREAAPCIVNPGLGELRILPGAPSLSMVRMLDLSGRVQLQIQGPIEGRIAVPELRKGLYVLELRTTDGRVLHQRWLLQ